MDIETNNNYSITIKLQMEMIMSINTKLEMLQQENIALKLENVKLKQMSSTRTSKYILYLIFFIFFFNPKVWE